MHKSYRSPAVHDLVIDVDCVVVDDCGTGVMVMWRAIEARGRNMS